ncbi:hypothetical protein ACFX2F_043083 [Malus domestica]
MHIYFIYIYIPPPPLPLSSILTYTDHALPSKQADLCLLVKLFNFALHTHRHHVPHRLVHLACQVAHLAHRLANHIPLGHLLPSLDHLCLPGHRLPYHVPLGHLLRIISEIKIDAYHFCQFRKWRELFTAHALSTSGGSRK